MGLGWVSVMLGNNFKSFWKHRHDWEGRRGPGMSVESLPPGAAHLKGLQTARAPQGSCH